MIPDGEAGRAVRHGAELAVAAANDAGGYRGIPFELVVRSDEGPWGSGSKEIAQLVFEDDVWAILGGLDGRRAHLAEQIVTKGRVTLVSPWASDPTLTQINIPWFFRCVPDDRRQAQALVEAMLETEGVKTVAVVEEATYDAQRGASALVRMAAGTLSINRFVVRAAPNAFQEVLAQIVAAKVEGIVFFMQPAQAAHVVRRMQARGMQQAVFGPMSLGEDIFLKAVKDLPNRARIVAPVHWESASGSSFVRNFQERYGYAPPTIAAYAYDGMSVILEAVRRAGLDRDAIREALATLTYPDGVTGPVRFDEQGNRIGSVTVVDVRNGRPDFLDEPVSPSSSTSEHQ